MVTSKQELHTFIKAAYSLAVTYKWLDVGLSQEVLDEVMQICRDALAQFSNYDSDANGRDGLCAEIMKLISQVKIQLQVKPFQNSNCGSFIPDSYRNIKESSASFTPEYFARLLQRFQKYHASLCDTTHTKCRNSEQIGSEGFCITALGTTVDPLNTECRTEACPPPKTLKQVQEAKHLKFELCTTQGCTEEAPSLDSSWQKLSLSNSGSNCSSGFRGGSDIVQENKLSNQSCATTETDVDDLDVIPKSGDFQDESKSNKLLSTPYKVTSSSTPSASSFSQNRVSEALEVMQAGIETIGTEEDWVNMTHAMLHKPGPDGTAQHPSQMTPKTSSSSPSDSFTFQSSWEKVSPSFSDATARKQQTQSKEETGQTSNSSELDGSFFRFETVNSESLDFGGDSMRQNHTSQQKISAHKKAFTSQKPNAQLCTSTQSSTGSSYDFLVENQDEHQTSHDKPNEKASVAGIRNSLCFNCKFGIFANIANESQYTLSQQDLKALLAGVCHDCLLKRLHSESSKFKLQKHQTAHSK